jgi:hypothetical protein
VYTFGGVAPWAVLGGGTAGALGAPQLAIEGSLCGGGSLVLRVSGGKPGAPALFIVGLSLAPQPWKGGTLWPSADLVVPVATNATGQATLVLGVPIGQPGMQTVVAQAWIAEASGPGGLASTPGRRGETP